MWYGGGTGSYNAKFGYATAPANINVPDDFETIQAAIEVSADGDIVELQAGTYIGNGNRDVDFRGKAITVRGSTGNPNDVIIDCQGTSADKHRGFKFVSGESPYKNLDQKDAFLKFVNRVEGAMEREVADRWFRQTPEETTDPFG